ncbi:MAG: hypothetical protein VB858_06575, partial [Planctomycetaceae bacterium]
MHTCQCTSPASFNRDPGLALLAATKVTSAVVSLDRLNRGMHGNGSASGYTSGRAGGSGVRWQLL